MIKKRIEMLIIDPQNDFCDKNGTLFVPGADADAIRLSAMITRLKKKISDIHVTLDSHHLVDVSHPIAWIDKSIHQNHPTPFTIISNDKWIATNPADQQRFANYLNALEQNGRYPHCIWPPHCLIGSWGHNVCEPIYKALIEWEEQFAVVDYVTKGSNIYTEHFSAVQAEVPDPEDPGTMLNLKDGGLISTISKADIILLTGQALSHCVANTGRDIANNFGEENIKKIILITDTTSSVPGFEDLGEKFVKEMIARGMQTTKSTEFMI